MKKIKILASLFLVVLVAGFASAFWPFDNGVMTGNVVSDTPFDDGVRCEDFDGGTFTDVASGTFALGRWYNTVKYDACEGSKKTIYFLDGNKIKKISGREKIKEYYCDDDARTTESYDESSLGKGVCITERITKGTFEEDVPRKTVTVGKWLAADPFCVETKPGTFRDDTGKSFKAKCLGKTYVEYSCSDDNITVLNTTANCGNKCSVKQKGCVGTCSGETDTTNDIDVAGTLNVASTQDPTGVNYPDKCDGGNRIIQYTCANSALKSVKSVSCGTNRICDDGDGSGAYCKDLYAGAGLIGTVTNLTGTVASSVSGLAARVASLETSATGFIKGNCAPSGGFGSGETGIEVCQSENKTCLIGLNYARMMNSTSGNIVPLHLSVVGCAQNQSQAMDVQASGDITFDVDPSWICC